MSGIGRLIPSTLRHKKLLVNTSREKMQERVDLLHVCLSPSFGVSKRVHRARKMIVLTGGQAKRARRERLVLIIVIVILKHLARR